MELKITDVLLVVENLFLTAFTYLLYDATKKLWTTSNEQRAETQKAISLTESSIEISRRDQEIHLRSVELAQKTFVVAHPPKLDVIVYQITFGTDENLFVPTSRLNGSFLVMNSGGTRARITDVDAVFLLRQNRLPLLERVIHRQAQRQLGPVDIWLMPAGEAEYLVDSRTAGLSQALAEELNSRAGDSGWRLFFQGWVRYEDELGNQKTTFFCHQFNRVTRGFEPISIYGYERSL